MEFTRASLDEVEMVMEVVNTAYRVEIGSEGIAFKSNDRFAHLETCVAALPNLWVARQNNEVVGVIGAVVTEDGEADLGPIAVVSKGRGVGSAMLSWAEAKFPITTVGVVSCRTDLIPWYEKRGYETFKEIPFETSTGVRNKDFQKHLTQRGLTYIMKRKINRA